MITGAAKVAGVVGWPVKHSLSPLIHNAWIEGLGLDAVYIPLAIEPARFDDFGRSLRSGALSGVNVTLPFKEQAYAIADTRSDASHQALAANLLIYADDELLADNTDGFGLIGALSASGRWRPENGPVLVLGSGGAASGAVAALYRAGVRPVRVAARREDAAQAAENRGWADGHAFGFDRLDAALQGVTAVINATSAGLNGVGELPPMDAAPPGAVFMDMVYSPLRTKFLRDAAARGHSSVDGLSMLIGQARPSFEAFFGVPPPPPEVVDVRALCLKALGEASD